MWDAFLIKLRLNFEMQLSLTCVLWQLVFYNCNDGEVIRLHRNALIFYLHYKDCLRETWPQIIGQRRCMPIANHVRHVWNSIWNPLQTVRLGEAASDYNLWQGYLFHFLWCQCGDSLVQVERFKRNLKHSAHSLLGLITLGSFFYYKGI